MSDKTHKTYSTGELARECGTTVRTVQYYDQRGLLAPSGHSDGGRRRYVDEDVDRLRQILLLKGLGVPLDTIREALDGSSTPQLVVALLEEHDRRLEAEAREREDARRTIAYLLAQIRSTGTLPIATQADVERIMEATKQLRHARITMGIAVAGFLAATFAVVSLVPEGDARGGVILLVSAAFVAWTMWYYHREVAFECPVCHTVFSPGYARVFVAPHTPTTRRLRCPHCASTSWCVEVGASRLREG